MKTFLQSELRKAEETAAKTVASIKQILGKQVRRYGWTDGGSLYIGGSLSREELTRSSDIDLIYFKSAEAREGRYSPSAISAFRTAAIATVEVGRKVSIVPVSDPETFAGHYAPLAFSAGLLKGTDRHLAGFFTADAFGGEDGDRRLRKLRQNLIGLASIANLDRDCIRLGFNGYRYAVLASALAEILGTDDQRVDAKTFRKILFAYCQASERVNGHCGLDGAENVIGTMTPEERSDGGVNLIETVDSARSGVKGLLTELCQQQS